MDPAIPLSPTSSSDGQLPQGFGDLVQHNSNATSFPREQRAMEAANLQNISHQASRMSTPAPSTGASPHLDHGLPHYPPQGMYNNQYFPPGYGPDSGYPSLPDDSTQPGYTTPASSPSQRSDVISLRNGAAPRSSSMRSLASKGQVEKPAPKKKKAARGAKRVPKVDKPLSELTKDWHEPMINIEEYVNRSAEERAREIQTGKNPGKVKRPMNAFMLYRKAYQNRTREWCTHNNHQVVSQVCGDSWPLEPEHIRNQFTEWARVERENHAKAHPDYKFAPQKPKNQKRKADSDEEAEPEEPFDDWYGTQGRPIKRSRSTRHTPVPDHEALYSQHMPQYYPEYSQQQGMMMPGRGQVNMSNFHYSNPNKPMPAPYNTMSLQPQSHYFQSQAMPTRHQQLSQFPVEDVSFHKTASPGNPYHSPQQSLMDSYGSVQQHHSMERTPPPGHMFEAQLEASMYSGNESSFNASDPLLLQSNSLEAAAEFYYADQSGQQVVEEYLGDVAGDPLGEQHFKDILQGSGSDENWQIQQLGEGQNEDQFDANWPQVDPCLSEPFTATAHD
ncbi:HMG-box protein STE11 [Cytospora mali]|uniref:HMG-box protein STE11 n=1 Tax=Cytospora mali TaxID=578113 RepID=A0A194UZT0_CYTMA|nr:HMG-box protein STE11 [Valsa mali var. pyri (nom. inval.)]